MQGISKIFQSFIFIIMLMFGMSQAQAAETAGHNGAGNEKAKFSEFVWNELAASNVQTAKDFYGKVFGWKFKEETVGDMTYTMATVNGKEFAGIWAIPKNQEKEIPPHWLAYIMVENLEQSLEKATKNGATVIKPITNAGDYGRLAIIKDPSGAHLGLWQSTKEKH